MGLLDSFRSTVHVFLRHQDYYPGNVVEGYVQIVVSSPMSFVAIRVEASGEEYVKIERSSTTTNSDGSTTTDTSTYTDSKLLFRELITLVGEMKITGNRRAQTAPPGCYTYPFAFQLPVSLPPSVYLGFGSDGHASISYVVNAYVDIPNGFDSNGRQTFRVLSSLPKRQWVDRRPMDDRVQWDVTCCCCIKKGKVSAVITSDRTVFAADRDRVVLDVDLDNSLGEEPIESVEVDLLNSCSCTASSYSNSGRFRVGGVKLLTAIPAGGKGHVQASIPIPRDARPSVQGYILACSYSIAVELNIPWASNPTRAIPAALGSTVDETDSLPLQSLYARQHTEVVPGAAESYYVPPPSTVYTYNPVPLPTVLANGAVETQYAAPAFAVQPARP